jgi:ADP-ribose pyrophosphatase YjhB (NUDIX family)
MSYFDDRKFNIRVYGIAEDSGKILLSDEYHRGLEVLKFPGGGLLHGEGPRECLIREFLEETGTKVDVRDHVYTTDFFQTSVFDNKVQVICIYYKVMIPRVHTISVNDGEKKATREDGSQQLIWKKISRLNSEELTFPSDRLALQQFLRSL